MPDKIKKISALEIIDSRGNPTVEVTIEAGNGTTAVAAVPSGASTGRFEAHELRDGDPHRYEGKGVLKAIDNVNKVIAPELIGLKATEQKKIDELMIKLDGTKNKSKLGANAILGVSLAAARLAAKLTGQELFEYLRGLYDPKNSKYILPTPVVNVINGGKHGGTNINIQEFWVVPSKVKEFREKVRQSAEVFHKLGDLLKGLGMDTDVGNEGGYSPNVKSHRQVFDLITQAIESAGYEPGEDIMLGIDAGASEFYDNDKKKYVLPLENKEFDAEDMIDFYIDLMEVYPLRFLEDPLDQEDWTAWQEFSKDDHIKASHVKLIGDDLFVTNVSRLKKGIDMGVANTILIKPNQIGTLTETFAAIRLAQENDYKVIISHRSGETSDTSIADLAVAVNSDYIKTGSTSRGERTAKYNRLLNIEEKLK